MTLEIEKCIYKLFKTNYRKKQKLVTFRFCFNIMCHKTEKHKNKT